MECDGHADVAPPRMDEVDAVGYEFDDLIPAYVERCESKVVRIIGERWAIAISGTSGSTRPAFSFWFISFAASVRSADAMSAANPLCCCLSDVDRRPGRRCRAMELAC